MKRARYMINWTHNDKNGRGFGRDGWVMERKGKLSTADIIRMEYELAKKWGYKTPVVITNVQQIN